MSARVEKLFRNWMAVLGTPDYDPNRAGAPCAAPRSVRLRLLEESLRSATPEDAADVLIQAIFMTCTGKFITEAARNELLLLTVLGERRIKPEDWA